MATADEIRANAKRLEQSGAPLEDIEKYVSLASKEIEPISTIGKISSGLSSIPRPPIRPSEIGQGLKSFAMPLISPTAQRMESAAETAGQSFENITGLGNVADTLASSPNFLPKFPPQIKAAGLTALDIGLEGVSPRALSPQSVATQVGMGAVAPIRASGASGLLSESAPEVGIALRQAPKDIVTGIKNAPGNVIEGAKSVGRQVAYPTLSKIGGVSREAIETLEKKPEVLKAPMVEELAQTKLPKVAESFDEIRRGLAEKAGKTLSTSRYLNDGAIPKTDILKTIDSVRKDLGGVYTPESQAAAKVLDKIKSNFGKLRTTVSQNNIHDIIKVLDKEIPWNKLWEAPETLTATDESLISLRTSYDEILKNSNKNYADIMKPLSETINVRNEFLKKFNFKKGKPFGELGRKYEPGDMTVSKLKNSLKEGKLESKRVLGKAQKITGENIEGLIKDALVREEIEKSTVKLPFTKLEFGMAPVLKTATKILKKNK